MANLDHPNGFHLYSGARGDGPNARIRHFTIDSGVSGTIGKGQPCKLSITTGHIVEIDGTTFANDSGAAAGTGIWIAKKACVAGDTLVPFIDAYGLEFLVQGDDDWAPASQSVVETAIGLGHCYGITNPNAISTDGLKRSTAELDGNSTPADDNYLMITGWEDTPKNEFGQFQNLVVRFHSALFERAISHAQLS